jgi:hypothetical protein
MGIIRDHDHDDFNGSAKSSWISKIIRDQDGQDGHMDRQSVSMRITVTSKTIMDQQDHHGS